MCVCGLGEDLHWWSDSVMAPNMWQVASSAEHAEHSLRSWAGKVVRRGHVYLDLRPLAARILAAEVLNMRRLCVVQPEGFEGILET